MKLLFDANLSYKLARNLSDLFPDSAHVNDLRLSDPSDWTLWTAARAGGFAIVTKDQDLSELAVVKGHPPKILWIRLRNCSTGQIESLLRRRAADVQQFLDDSELSVLELS